MFLYNKVLTKYNSVSIELNNEQHDTCVQKSKITLLPLGDTEQNF